MERARLSTHKLSSTLESDLRWNRADFERIEVSNELEFHQDLFGMGRSDQRHYLFGTFCTRTVSSAHHSLGRPGIYEKT